MSRRTSKICNDENVSVSKGVFSFNKNIFGARTRSGKSFKTNQHRTNHKDTKWYIAFQEIWSAIQNNVSQVNENTFKQILEDLKDFVDKVKMFPLLTDEIPTGILLAGVNLPDHDLLLQKLTDQLDTVTPYISTVWSRDAGTLKSFIEEIVHQFVNKHIADDSQEVKRMNCTFQVLEAWHEENLDKNTPLVVIIPDFEGFSPKILHDFILILSSYSKSIKFVLIFGVATSLHIVHRSLSYDATSKLKFQVFHTETQKKILEDVLESIVLTPTIPFKLIGRAFSSLVDIFLFYDFSVNSFLQSYKLCMWKHFYGADEKSICCNMNNIRTRIKNLDNEELKYLKELDTVQKYLKREEATQTSEEGFKKILMELTKECHLHMKHFLVLLKCLHVLSSNLPVSDKPLGEKFYKVYALAVNSERFCETEPYKKTIQYLNLLSKEELLDDIKLLISVLKGSDLKRIILELEDHFQILKDASMDVTLMDTSDNISLNVTGRRQFLDNLKSNSQKSESSPYLEARTNFFKFLDKDFFAKYLVSPFKIPLHEIYCYSDVNAINGNLTGSMKALIHRSLSDPHYILKCQCCKSNGEGILSTFPDICIIFKLHLESRKMINLYDWLTSFVMVVDTRNDDDDNNDVPPFLHARFTQTVAELQFLGFIKATRAKTDHVKKLIF